MAREKKITKLSVLTENETYICDSKRIGFISELYELSAFALSKLNIYIFTILLRLRRSLHLAIYQAR